jgi:L-galactose dehydrogenase
LKGILRMDYRVLGRTGLKVSVMGVGGGGPTQLGQKTGVDQRGVNRLIRRAIDLGINFFDTAAAYGESEAILGEALKGIPRERYILATKFHPARGGKGEVVTPREVAASVARSLKRLKVDAVDLMQFHGVRPNQYTEVMETLWCEVDKLKQQGKFRFIGITETYGDDNRHEMLPEALKTNLFDTAMVGYNMIGPTPEHVILPLCQTANVGVICMVAVRRALSRPDYLKAQIALAKSRGLIASNALPDDDPLGWLIRDGVGSLPAAAYKYVNAHPAMGTVLSGTANIEHLEENVKAILGPPLPTEDMGRLRSVFGQVWEPLGN